MEKIKGREDVEKSENERSSGGEREREICRKEILMMREVWRRVRMREYVEDSENQRSCRGKENKKRCGEE